jgi:hypothetical protein
MKNKKEEKQKSYYDIKVEATLPAVITYRILAESAEDAIEMLKLNKNQHSPIFIKYDLLRKKSIKATVYDAGCSVIKHSENTDKI